MLRNFKGIFICFFWLGCISPGFSQNPGTIWEQYKTPEEAGWSSQKLVHAKTFYDQLASAAFLVIYDGHVLLSWGDIERRYMCHSIRKSYLSALYGFYAANGAVKLDQTMADLKIDDKDTLTAIEKQARISDLLKARSGVYHSAAYETPKMKAARPPRGTHPRNTFWYYNNWDFNVLCTILEKISGTDIFTDYLNRIATPLQMQDYRLIDGYHHLEAQHSIHAAYPFKMSARDMARFGLLFLRKGRWNHQQLISETWIQESTTSYSEAHEGGYGYMWWIEGPAKAPGMYLACGYGGHVIAVHSTEKLVFVHRVNTYLDEKVPYKAVVKLINRVREAKTDIPRATPSLVPLPAHQPQDTFILSSSEELRRYVGKYSLYHLTVEVKQFKDRLLLTSPEDGSFNLLQLSREKFFLEDMEAYAVFELDQNAAVKQMTLHQSEASADLFLTIIHQGLPEALEQYQTLKNRSQTPYTFRYSELKQLGYQLLQTRRFNEARKIFQLNAENHPHQADAYNCLGDVYWRKDRRPFAIRYYQRALQLESNNQHALKMLKKLNKDIKK